MVQANITLHPSCQALLFQSVWKWSESVSHSILSTLCDLMDCSLPGSSVHEILQERILQWCWEPAHEIPPMTRSRGESVTGKVDQVFRGFKKAISRDPTHDKVMRRKPDRQEGSGFQGFQKAAPSAHLKDDICLSDACLNRLLPNFRDTGRRLSLISFQIRINLEL